MEPKQDRVRFQGGVQPVYVTNPEMSCEYEILKASGIYLLSGQTNGTRRLTLYPMGKMSRCANPLMLTGLTLGIVPGVLPAGRVFKYDLEADGVVERYVHILPLSERFSVWEWFVRQNKQEKCAEALAWSSRRQWPVMRRK